MWSTSESGRRIIRLKQFDADEGVIKKKSRGLRTPRYVASTRHFIRKTRDRMSGCTPTWKNEDDQMLGEAFKEVLRSFTGILEEFVSVSELEKQVESASRRYEHSSRHSNRSLGGTGIECSGLVLEEPKGPPPSPEEEQIHCPGETDPIQNECPK